MGNTWYWGGTSSSNPVDSQWKSASVGTYGTLANGDVAIVQLVPGLSLYPIGAGTMSGTTLAALIINGFDQAIGESSTPWRVGASIIEVNQGGSYNSGRISIDTGGVPHIANVRGTGQSPSDTGSPVVRLVGTSTLNELHVSGRHSVGYGANYPAEPGVLAKVHVNGGDYQSAGVTLGEGISWTEAHNNGGDLLIRKPSATGTLLNVGGRTFLRGIGTNGTMVAIGGVVYPENRPAASTDAAIGHQMMRGGGVDWSSNPSNVNVTRRGTTEGGQEVFAYANQVTVTTIVESNPNTSKVHG